MYFGLALFAISPLAYLINKKIKVLPQILIAFSILLLSIFFYKGFLPKEEPAWTKYYNGESVRVNGTVVSEPEGEKVKRFFFKPEDTKGNIAVTLGKGSDVSYGDTLTLEGDLKEPENKGEFDYKSYLQRYNVFSETSFPEAEPIIIKRNFLEENLITLKKNLFALKNNIVLVLEKIYPEPNASLMLGLLLGIKKTMPDELLEAFNTTGTTHIIALSGFNITIIVMLLKNLTNNLSRRLKLWLPLLVIILFVLMTGAEATVVRAAIMGSMLLLARFVGRQDDATIAVLFAAFIMILENPFILRFDIGFQLSFACMMGLIYLGPIFQNIFRKLPKIISENLGMTLAAQIAAIPILLYYFGAVSLIAPLANILILPAVPLAMAFAAISASFYLLVPFLGEAFGYIGLVLTSYIIGLATLLSNLPYASLNFQTGWVFVVFYYLILLDAILITRYIAKKVREQNLKGVTDAAK